MRKPSYYNSEGYPSPTEYYGLLHIMEEERARKAELHKYRPLVYVCSPFAGDVKTNVKNARLYSRFAVIKGYLPITPHLLFPQFLRDSDADEREIGMHMGLVLLSMCQELWVFGETISPGMAREIKKARWYGKRIRFFNEKLQEEKK